VNALFDLHAHGFDWVTFIQHLTLDSIASAGGYYASRFCSHLWHRIVVAVFFTLLSTALLVTLVG
jgi:hypothetical protein